MDEPSCELLGFPKRHTKGSLWRLLSDIHEDEEKEEEEEEERKEEDDESRGGRRKIRSERVTGGMDGRGDGWQRGRKGRKGEGS